MTRQRIIVGAFLLAAVLWVIAGLRDIFAPGFFNISSRVMGKSDIILEFAVAAIFIALAGLVIRHPEVYSIHKK
jgi:hypothetical protein